MIIFSLKNSPNIKGSVSALFVNALFSLILVFTLLPVQSATSSQTKTFSDEDLNRKIGQAIFDKIWVFAPSSTKSSDGLGPFYNARSCKQCHDLSNQDNDSRLMNEITPHSLVIQLSVEHKENAPLSKENLAQKKHLGFIPEPTYGKQIQTFAYPGAPAEAIISLSTEMIKVRFPDNAEIELAKPVYQLSALAYGPLNKDFRFSPRIAPRMQAMMFFDELSDAQILKAADPNDADNNGISGRVNWVWDPITQTQVVGRFGWKAAKANLQQQNLAALATDIGVSSWLFPEPEGDCTKTQVHCIQLAKNTETHITLKSDHQYQKDKVEASRAMTDLLLLFTKRIENGRSIKLSNTANQKRHEGEAIFHEIECYSCHSNDLILDNIDTKSAKISTQKLIYTDLLLHDMGEGLTDNREEFSASGNEWRTAPLLGISDYIQQTNQPRFLHDGRARSLVEAIIWHGGEAEQSKQKFMALSKIKRQSLIEFIASL